MPPYLQKHNISSLSTTHSNNQTTTDSNNQTTPANPTPKDSHSKNTKPVTSSIKGASSRVNEDLRSAKLCTFEGIQFDGITFDDIYDNSVEELCPKEADFSDITEI